MQRVNAKLAVQKSLQTEEIITLKNRINGLENAQNRLIACLEDGKASKTILDKMQKNETELSALNEQLTAKSKQISTIDDTTYDKLVKQFVGYMSFHFLVSVRTDSAIPTLERRGWMMTIYMS